MSSQLLSLYPGPTGETDLSGLYLQHNLQKRGKSERPFVYSNFVTSLDGRIAVAASGRASHEVPKSIANPRDWRLYQELAAQSDLLITSGRYFRQCEVGEEQDRLPLAQGSAFEDLHRWRADQGLTPQPDVVILSASLELPDASLAPYRNRRVWVATGEDADPRRVARLEALEIPVLRVGDGRSANGQRLLRALAREGYRSIYAIAGPSVLFTLLQDRVLDRLYLTLAHRILAGEDFDTITWGPSLPDPVSLNLTELHLDQGALESAGQLLAVYDCQYA
jgi:riboflavin biosynthesis pyrimidine reductase